MESITIFKRKTRKGKEYFYKVHERGFSGCKKLGIKPDINYKKYFSGLTSRKEWQWINEVALEQPDRKISFNENFISILN